MYCIHVLFGARYNKIFFVCENNCSTVVALNFSNGTIVEYTTHRYLVRPTGKTSVFGELASKYRNSEWSKYRRKK